MITIYGKEQCPYCDMAKKSCEQAGYDYEYKQLGTDFDREEMMNTFPTARTFPQIIVDGEKIGGYQQLQQWHDTDWNEK